MSEYITVNLPDGTQARFPSSMGQDEIQAVLQEQFGKQSEADMSLLGRLRDNVMGVDDGVMSPGEKLGTMLNKAGESMTFGLVGDEASAAAAAAIPGGMGYDERLAFERENEARLEKENPGLALGADIGGAVMGAALPLGSIGTLARGGLAARTAASGAAGAGMGGLYGFMEGEGDNRLDEARTGAVWGGAAGVAAPVIGNMVKRGVDAVKQRGPIRAARKAATSAAQERAASRADYKVFENADVQMTPAAFRRMKDNINSTLQGRMANIPGPMGKLDGNARKIKKTLDAMEAQLSSAEKAGKKPFVKLQAIDDLRKEVSEFARETKEFRPTKSAMLSGLAVKEIDEFVDGLSSADIPIGDSATAKAALKKARAAWKKSIKLQKVENAVEASGEYLSGPQSGLRFQIKKLLRENRKTKMFSGKEEEALRKIIGNSVASRQLRLLQDGLGRKMATVFGGLAGGPMGAAMGAGISEAATQIGDTTAMRKAQIAKELISSGVLNNLPQMSDANRNLSETLARRIGVALGQ